jgi:3-hydroxymyristoyl/3-hydroxydecanoyl-(acyl carrier protein) dehydratase
MQNSDTEPAAVEREQIETILAPISGNFVLPERVVLGPDGNSATGYMTVMSGPEYIRGHFGVLPGVMQIEFAQQTLGILMSQQHPDLAGVMHCAKEIEIGMMAKAGDEIEARVRVVEWNLNRGKGRPVTEATIQGVGDATRQSTMTLIPQVMPRRLFERIVSPHE